MAINWGSIGESALQTGIGAGLDFVGDLGGSLVSNYFGKKSSKKSYERQLSLMAEQYKYAQRYAENGPSWAVAGLRKAGLNPILAAGGGVHMSSPPSAPSSPSAHSVSGGGSRVRYDPLLSKQIESLDLDNELKRDHLKTQRAENEVKRLKSEAAAGILRPVSSVGLEGDGKSVSVLLPSKSFKALQKAIADDYDLRSERYVRETIDAVMRYGKDVLSLLPAFRRKEIMETISTTIKSGKTSKTYTTHGPKK